MSLFVTSFGRPSPGSYQPVETPFGTVSWRVEDAWQVACLIATLCTLPLTVHPPKPVVLGRRQAEGIKTALLGMQDLVSAGSDLDVCAYRAYVDIAIAMGHANG